MVRTIPETLHTAIDALCNGGCCIFILQECCTRRLGQPWPPHSMTLRFLPERLPAILMELAGHVEVGKAMWRRITASHRLDIDCARLRLWRYQALVTYHQ